MCPEHGKWPLGYHKVGDQDHYYTIIQKPVSNWDDAQAMCNELGASLVTIHSAEENAFVKRFRRGVGQRRWLGLTTNYKERNYSWIDCTETGIPPYLNFENRSRYEQLIKNRTCILMLTTGGWFYGNCNYSFPFTCKKPAPSRGKQQQQQ